MAEKYARIPRIIVDAFAAFMCGVLAWHSWRYIELVIEFEDTVLIDVPAWMAYILLPFSFVLMSYRFLLAAGIGLLKTFSKEEEGAE